GFFRSMHEESANPLPEVTAVFNVATHFVDRNVAEGRGDRIAFHCGDLPMGASRAGAPAPGRAAASTTTLTYRDVLELTNRTGNALRDLGVEMEHRVLMVCLDAPEFI